MLWLLILREILSTLVVYYVTDSLNITTGYTAINQDIVSNSLDLTTDDFFRKLTGGDINASKVLLTVNK